MKNFWILMKNTAVSLGRRAIHRWPLKLLSLLFAIILWNFVLGQTNPLRIVRVSDINIQAININTLYNNDLTLTEPIENSLPKVWVTMEVPLQEVSRASDMVTVTADMRSISQPGMISVPLTITTSSSGRVVSQSIESIQVFVEKRISRTFAVNVDVQGAMPDGYYINKSEVEPGSITVSGPESVVKSIQKVQVPVQIQGRNTDFRMVRDLELLDADGKPVEGAMLTVSNQDAIVNVEIYRSKELPILLDKAVIGRDSLAPGYEIISMDAVPASVTVVGDPETVDAMTGVDISLVDMKNAASDVKVTRSIKLPNGAYSRDTSLVEVVIRVHERIKSLSLTDVPIRYTGLPEGLEFADQPPMMATVELRGPESTLAKISVANIRVEADVSQCIPGRNTIPLELTVPDSYRVLEQMVSPVTVEVVVQTPPPVVPAEDITEEGVNR